MTRPCHFCFTPMSARVRFDSASILLQGLRLHFDFTSVQIWCRCEVTPIPLWSHFGIISSPLRHHFGVLSCDFDSGSHSFWVHFNFMRSSLRYRFGCTLMSLWFHFAIRFGLTSFSSSQTFVPDNLDVKYLWFSVGRLYPASECVSVAGCPGIDARARLFCTS